MAQARDLYLQLLICQQAIPVQRGASLYAANFLDYYQILSLDALSLGVKGFNYEGVWGQPDQIGWTTSGAALTPLAADAGVSLEPQAAAPAASADSESDEEAGVQLPPLLPFGEPAGGKEGASSVEVIFSADASTSFTYDAGTGHYLMARADGSPQTDANTGAQAGFDNVLILYSAPSRRDDGYSWGYDLTMGAGIYLNGGSVWSILWMPGADSTLAIYNSDGTALRLHSTKECGAHAPCIRRFLANIPAFLTSQIHPSLPLLRQKSPVQPTCADGRDTETPPGLSRAAFCAAWVYWYASLFSVSAWPRRVSA